jgi:hypothetical protein
MFPPPLGLFEFPEIIVQRIDPKKNPYFEPGLQAVFYPPGLLLAAAVLTFSNPQSPLLALTFSGSRSLMALAVARESLPASGGFPPLPAGRPGRAGLSFSLFRPDGKKHG